MNHYPSYPHTPGSGPAQSSNTLPGMPSDPRLPPRPPPQQPPGAAPAYQQHRGSASGSGSGSGSGSYGYPPFPPPPPQSFPSNAPPFRPPPPPQQSYPYNPVNNAQSNYGGINQSPVRDQRYDSGPGPGPGAAPSGGTGYGARPPPPNAHSHVNEPYPSLPPLRFTDRPNPPPPPVTNSNSHGYQGYNGPNIQNQTPYGGQGQTAGYQGSPPPPARDFGNQRPRENFNLKNGRQGRGRSPDPARKPHRQLGDRDRDGRTLETRLQLERACRTLFVRNVNYEADSDALRADFERFGQIKTYFDLVKQRGMIFITYHDLRAAERARDGMHDSIVKNRKIDVHYSLPRADEQKKPADRDSNQGSIVVTLLRQSFLHENDLGRLCEQFGDIKTIRPGRSPDQKIVEYFDSRGAALFFDERNHQPFQGGELDLMFIWDEPESSVPPPPPAPSYRDDRNQEGPRGNNRNGPPFDDHRDDRGGGGGGHRGGQGGGRGGRRSGEGPGYGEVRSGRFDDRRGDDRGGFDRRGSGGGSRDGQPPGRYDAAPPVPPVDDRLEQARKVQDLLASLSGSAVPPPQSSSQNGYQPPRPASQGYQQPPPQSGPSVYRPGDPRDPRQGNAGTMPPFPPGNNGPEPPRYSAPPSNPQSTAPYQTYNYGPPTTAPPAAPPSGGNGGIPPEVLSLLQANNVGPPPIPPSTGPAYLPPAPVARNQGYNPGPPPPRQNNEPYRPPPPAQQYDSAPYAQNQGGQSGYQQGGGYQAGPDPRSQQPQQGCQPGPGGGNAKDVGSLLAMLGNR